MQSVQNGVFTLYLMSCFGKKLTGWLFAENVALVTARQGEDRCMIQVKAYLASVRKYVGFDCPNYEENVNI